MATNVAPLSTSVLTLDQGVVTCMHITAKLIIVALDTGTLHIFDHEGANERIVKASETAIWSLDTWDDDLVFAGGAECSIGIWKLASLERMATLQGHSSTVRCLKAISVDEVVSSSRDATLRIWNVGTGDCTGVLEGHTGTIQSFAIHGDIIASVSYDSDARIWDLKTKKCLHVLKDHEGQIYSVVFDGTKVVTGSLDKTARVWDPKSGVCLAVLKGFTGLVSLLQILPGATLLTGDSAAMLRIWSLDDHTELRKMDTQGSAVTSMQGNMKHIVSGTADGSVKLWDFESGEEVRELVSSDAVWKVGYVGEKVAAVFRRDGKVVLSTWQTL